MKFLHCMKNRDYLEEALSDGLMFTDHQITFQPFRDRGSVEAHINDMKPFIDIHLARLGKNLQGLSDVESNTLFAGIGKVTGRWPMICLTEVPEGRNIQEHVLLFGAYGVVVSEDWVRRNQFDRVIYAGQDSPVSLQLWRQFSRLAIASLTQNAEGQLLHDNSVFQEVLGMCAYIEQRDNWTETEWRLPGTTGFFGEARNTGTRIPLPLDDIEMVLVQNDADVTHFDTLIANLVAQRAGSRTPRVVWQPAIIS